MKRATSIIIALAFAIILPALSGCEMCRDMQEYYVVEQAAEAQRPPNLHTGSFNCPCPECVSQHQPAPVQAPYIPQHVSAPPPVAPAGMACAEIFFPTGHPNTSAVHVRKCAPAQVQIGVPFEYTITIRNLTDQTLRNVVLTDELARNFRMSTPRPAPNDVDGLFVTWNFGDLGPGATRDIVIPGVATAAGALVNCVIVTFDMPVCLTTQVVNPRLKLSKTAPSDVLACETIPVRIVVSNVGDGNATNVQVVDRLPDGLLTADGRREMSFNVGTLGQGEARELAFDVKAQRTGSYTNTAIATADGNLRAEASATTVVRQPVLSIKKTGPAKRYLNRPIEYSITVTNTGSGEARDTVIEDLIPAGVELLKVSDNGAQQGGKVIWNLGTLQPKDARTVTMTVSGDKAGEFTNIANATAYCAAPVSDEVKTVVQGIPAILLEVIDLDDPIEVGAETVYEISVTNQGTMADTNINITARLEDQAEYVSSEGLTTGSNNGKLIQFAPVKVLAPKATATWRVRVKAIGDGDIRFHVQMNSDQIGRNVMETEATHFYQ